MLHCIVVYLKFDRILVCMAWLLAEKKVHLLNEHTCLILPSQTEINDTILKNFSLGQEKSYTFANGRFTNAWHTQNCSQSVLQHTGDDLLHLRLASNKLIVFCYLKRESGLWSQVFNQTGGEGPKHRAFVLAFVRVPYHH